MKKFTEIAITVDSKVIDLNPFTETILGNTIEAMILSLRLEENPKVVEIRLTR